MITKKRTPDFGAISRSSIKKDFQRVQRYPAEENKKLYLLDGVKFK